MIEMRKFLLDRIHNPPWCPTVMKDHLCGGGNFQHVSLVGGFSPTHLKNISSQIGSFPPKGMKIIKSIKKPPSSSTYPATGNESTSPTDSKWKFGKSFDSKKCRLGWGDVIDYQEGTNLIIINTVDGRNPANQVICI